MWRAVPLCSAGPRYSQNVIKILKLFGGGNKHITLPREFYHDLAWCSDFAPIFNGDVQIIKSCDWLCDTAYTLMPAWPDMGRGIVTRVTGWPDRSQSHVQQYLSTRMSTQESTTALTLNIIIKKRNEKRCAVLLLPPSDC